VAGVAAFTLFAAFVAITRPASHVGDVMPVVIGGLAGVAAAMWLFRASAPQVTEGQMVPGQRTREPLRSGAVRHGHGGSRRRTR
jgi:xanthine/uracil permease